MWLRELKAVAAVFNIIQIHREKDTERYNRTQFIFIYGKRSR